MMDVMGLIKLMSASGLMRLPGHRTMLATRNQCFITRNSLWAPLLKAESDTHKTFLIRTMPIQILDKLDLAISVEHTTCLSEPAQSSRDCFGLAVVSIHQNRTKSWICKTR